MHIKPPHHPLLLPIPPSSPHTHLQLLQNVSIQREVRHSLAVLQRDGVHQPQGQGAGPGASQVHDGVEQGHVGPSDGRVTDSGVERYSGHKQSLSIQRLSERNSKTGSITNFHLRTTGEDTWPRTQAFLRSFFFLQPWQKVWLVP